MAPPRSVLIVDDRHDVLELNRILLEAEGYEAVGCSYREATVERLRRERPGVLLLDLVLRTEEPWDLLRRLRQDPSLEDIGVVVTSDAAALVDRALREQTLGVAAGLVMPFDIEVLYAAIAAAGQRGQPAQAVSVNPLLDRVALLLRRDRQRILLRWIQRLSTFDVFRRQPDLSLAALQGQGSALLDGIAAALEVQSSSRDVAAMTVGGGADAAHAHARLRHAQGARAADLAREVAALRREIWLVAHGEAATASASRDDAWGLLRRVDAAADEALCAMLDTWSHEGITGHTTAIEGEIGGTT
jgi:DNA-binding response OmpR family regulator